jgi:hypothetical protein
MKLYARLLRAHCPVENEDLERMIPVLQDVIVPRAAAGKGCKQVLFFVDRTERNGNVFSITVYDSEDALTEGMKEATSDYRFEALAGLGCTAVSARALEVVAGQLQVDSEAPTG